MGQDKTHAVQSIWWLLSETFKSWNEDNGPLFAAALAFYMIFSIAPILTIMIAIAGLVLGPPTAEQEITRQIQGLVGEETSATIRDLVRNSVRPAGNIVALTIGITTMLFGSTLVFYQTKSALNAMWDTKPKPGRGIRGMVWDRVVAFLVLLGISLLVILLMITNALLPVLHFLLDTLVPNISLFWKIVHVVIPQGMMILFVGIIFKVLPDVQIAWGDVWVGATVTGILLNGSQYLLSHYMVHSGVTSTYGAAGSLIVFLVWMNVSAQIFLFGAEFTQVYAHAYGSKIVPFALIQPDRWNDVPPPAPPLKKRNGIEERGEEENDGVSGK
jgi:membrane protein